MGNVGNIEKVMVFGILAIIVVILSIAIWGHNAISEPALGAPAEEEAFRAPQLRNDVPATSAPVAEAKTQAQPRPLVAGSRRPAAGGRAAFDPARARDVTRRPVASKPKPKPAAAAPKPALPRTHVVRPGDTFEKLAVEYFGDRKYAVEFQKANEDVDPRRLQVGQHLNVPVLDGVEPVGARVSRVKPSASKETTAARARTYVVRKGDTLSSISRRFYGSSGRWKKILEANRRLLTDPDQLRPGMELVIP